MFTYDKYVKVPFLWQNEIFLIRVFERITNCKGTNCFYPVDIRHRFNIYKTSIRCRQRRIDVL